MRVINEAVLVRFARKHPDVRSWLEDWLESVREADWSSLEDVRRIYSSADGVRMRDGSAVTVFNVGGNKYRMITRIFYTAGMVVVLDLMTHADYSKDHWKRRL